MNDLKVGDIVHFDRISSAFHARRGVITKIETKIAKGLRTPRTYAVVFWFRSRERLAVNVDWLIKLEVGGG